MKFKLRYSSHQTNIYKEYGVIYVGKEGIQRMVEKQCKTKRSKSFSSSVVFKARRKQERQEVRRFNRKSQKVGSRKRKQIYIHLKNEEKLAGK